MEQRIHLPFLTLLLLISFASVNAVLFTPALPDIAKFFSISSGATQQTITCFLIGYAFGQLLYGPLANRFGRKKALYMGISLQIVSSFVCILAGFVQYYPLLVMGRFLLALGSGVGLKMTFTLINETNDPTRASQKISYLMLAFAITPSLSVALGGWLAANLGWMSCFYASALYGVLLLFLVARLPETKKELDYEALNVSHLLPAYTQQFTNLKLVSAGILMGASTAFVYAFATISPFVAIEIYKISSFQFGLANLIPPTGLLLGSILSARLATVYPLATLIQAGIWIAVFGVGIMFSALGAHLPVIFALFMPMVIIFFGLCFILANASSLALAKVADKSHGSAVMNFLNMATATVVILVAGLFKTSTLLLPFTFVVLCILMMLASWVCCKESTPATSK